MKQFHGLEQIWTIRQIHKGKILWEETKKNIVVDEGEKAIVDTFYRNNAATYFAAATFYVGLYKGSVGESTILAAIPNEPKDPLAYGYSRTAIERSVVGWPTIEQHENDWRVVSKTITITASGGNIGPVDGSFLCTSLDDTGVLIGAVAFKSSRTIPAGDKIEFYVRAKIK